MRATLLMLVAVFALSGCLSVNYETVEPNLRLVTTTSGDGAVTKSYEKYDQNTNDWYEVEKVNGSWKMTAASENKYLNKSSGRLGGC